ncbi:MAG: Lar family restriction alleviation protein [Candidatus Adiutrix sp.]|jgi:hypothetical protein|nr:Lar family restriction alleviation protein [Candidatus Adiutrix sp.]
MTVLKPCPFCGGEVRMDIIPGADVGGEEYYAGCDCLSNEPGAYGLESDGDTEESVAAQWNARPLEAALEARVRELEADLAQARAAVEKLIHVFSKETELTLCDKCPAVHSCMAGSDFDCEKTLRDWAYLPAPEVGA